MKDKNINILSFPVPRWFTPHCWPWVQNRDIQCVSSPNFCRQPGLGFMSRFAGGIRKEIGNPRGLSSGCSMHRMVSV